MSWSIEEFPMLAGKRILLVISGGIAAYKALDLIRRLRERGAAVRCILTRGGARVRDPAFGRGLERAEGVHGSVLAHRRERDGPYPARPRRRSGGGGPGLRRYPRQDGGGLGRRSRHHRSACHGEPDPGGAGDELDDVGPRGHCRRTWRGSQRAACGPSAPARAILPAARPAPAAWPSPWRSWPRSKPISRPGHR